MKPCLPQKDFGEITLESIRQRYGFYESGMFALALSMICKLPMIAIVESGFPVHVACKTPTGFLDAYGHRSERAFNTWWATGGYSAKVTVGITRSEVRQLGAICDRDLAVAVKYGFAIIRDIKEKQANSRTV